MRRNMCTLTICACFDCCLTLLSAGTGRIMSTFFRGRTPPPSSTTISVELDYTPPPPLSFLPFIPAPLLLPVKHCLSRQSTRIFRCPRELLEKLAEDAIRSKTLCTTCSIALTLIRVRELVRGVWDLYASFVTLSDACIDLSVSRCVPSHHAISHT
jgi:hypothetical protein